MGIEGIEGIEGSGEIAGVGIVGAGFLSETRARCYGKLGVPIAAVLDRTREIAAPFAERHRVPRVCAELDEFLALPEVDLVDLCVPNHLHRSMTEAAAAAGKHVICTKPLTAYVGQDLAPDALDREISAVKRSRMLAVATADAEAMVASARAAGVRLMYGENWAFAPAVARARQLLRTSGGSILEMRGWECHSGSHSPWAKLWRHTGGGALLRLAAHPIGAMIHLKEQEGIARIGRPIRAVAVSAETADLSRVSTLRPETTSVATGWEDVENWGCAVISFEDGSRGVAHGSDNMLGGMGSRLEICASNCRFTCNLSPNDLLRAYAPDPGVFGEEYLQEKVETSAGWSTPMPDEDWTSGQLAMIEDFVGAVREGREARTSGELGVEVVRVIYSAYLAAAEGRRVEITRPEDPLGE
jgi:predicted dehydrogenase